MSIHLGFRVRAQTPQQPYTMSSDDFEIRDAALDCAHLLLRAGWTQIDVFHVTRSEGGGEEKLEAVDWDRTKDAAKRLRKFQVTTENVDGVLAFLDQYAAPRKVA